MTRAERRMILATEWAKTKAVFYCAAASLVCSVIGYEFSKLPSPACWLSVFFLAAAGLSAALTWRHI